jgi:ribosomal protein L15E
MSSETDNNANREKPYETMKGWVVLPLHIRAIIAARKKIVKGAVSRVHMALQGLAEEKIVEMDDERKAAMVSNLLVILCGDKDASPIVNTGTLYT